MFSPLIASPAWDPLHTNRLSFQPIHYHRILLGRLVMLRSAQIRPVPLPRGWPRRVRPAVVQIISLARTSLALTQGWASESPLGFWVSWLPFALPQVWPFCWWLHSSTTLVIGSGDNRVIVGGGCTLAVTVPVNPLDLQRFPAAIRFIPLLGPDWEPAAD
jgi:hypothetical protein